MIKNNQRQLNQLQVILDALITAVSYVLAWYLRIHSGLMPLEGAVLPPRTYLYPLVFIVPGYLILYYFSKLYTQKRLRGKRFELSGVVQANIIGVLLFILVLYLIGEVDFSRQMLFIFFCINTVLECLFRYLVRVILDHFRKKGYNQKHILLVGYSNAAEAFIDRVAANPQWGYIIRGILDDDLESGTMYNGVKVIGRIDNLLVILPENRLDEIAITLSIDHYEKLGNIVAMCEKSGVHTKFIPDYNNIISSNPYTEDLFGLPVINIRYVPLQEWFNRFCKRALDIVGSLGALLLFSPIMLITVLLIKITSPGPIIFSQERVGRHNRNFKMYKFRSMQVQKESAEKKCWTTQNDPRVTGIGKFIRATSIDELPQLINVLKGDMSLVGPRPERPYFVDKFKEEIPRYMIKHQVRPGMTGWAQVNGFRGNTSIRHRIDFDLYYIEHWTFGFDIKILFLTIFKGFINKNAY